VNATFRVLDAARELDEFTVPMLVQLAEAKDATVRSVLRRHPQFFEQLEVSSTARRGGQTRLWRVIPEARGGLESEVAGLAARYGPPATPDEAVVNHGFRVRPQDAPDLATADDLNVFSGWGAAQRLLPELVQRLLSDAEGLLGLSVRTGDGVGIPGFDAVVESQIPSPWIPTGTSVWELGAGGDPSAKAQSDYKKRTEQLPANERAQTTFVVVSMARFRERESWLRRRQQAKEWRDVRAIDADDLYDWLSTVPAAHVWVSERMGLYPREVKSFERWWDVWSKESQLVLADQTKAALPSGLLLAGRNPVAVELVNRVRQARNQKEGLVLHVHGPSRDEVIGFVVTALAQWEGQLIGETPIRGLIVAGSREWDRVVQLGGDAVLVPAFEDADVSPAVDAGRCVIIPLGPGDAGGGLKLDLPPIARDEASQVLRELGLSPNDSYRFAGEARRSLSAFRRARASNQLREKPQWVHGETGALLASLVLLGEWAVSNDADLEVVATVTVRTYENVDQVLRELMRSDDPPFVIAGDRWRLASPQDAWGLLHGRMTGAALERWREQAVRVLSEPDPTVGLSDFEVFMAPARGISRRFSTALRNGIVRSIALIGANEDEQAPDTQPWSQHAAIVVDAVMRPDASANAWISLRDVLPELAEAAPDVFLDRATSATLGPDPALKDVLVSQDKNSLFGHANNHVPLLWALEVLCWLPDYFGSACEILVRMAEFDPEPSGSQRPAASLRSVLLPWNPQTAASVEQRIQLIDGLVNRHPKVGWNLLLSLLPQYFDSSSPNATPKFRLWQVTHRRDAAEEVRIFSLLITRALTHLKEHSEDWVNFFESLTTLPPADQERVISALEEARKDQFIEATLLVVWNALSTFIAKHRQFATAAWALPDEVVSRLELVASQLEPATSPERFARLFDWHPDLPGTDKFDHEGYDQRLEIERKAAIQQIVRETGPEGLTVLASAAAVPGFVGRSIADAVGEKVTAEMLAMLSEPRSARLAASSWLMRLAEVRTIDRTLLLRNQLNVDNPEAIVEFYLSFPASQLVWNRLAQEDTSVREEYWRRVLPRPLDEGDEESFVEELLDHSRPWTAIEVLAMLVHRSTGPRHDLVERALRAATESQDDPLPTSPDYEVSLLLDQLVGVSNEDTLVQLEWAYFALLQHTRPPQVLFERLRRDPDFFIQLVCAAFRASDEPKRDVSEQEQMVGQQSMLVLRDWRRPPGLREDGTIDVTELRGWVEQARAGLAASKRIEIGEQMIGELLSGAGPGEDEIWPPEAIRELLEETVSRDLETGLAIGKFNSRGATSRAMFQGGSQVDALASRYDDWSRRTMARWPATGRLLREMANHYRSLARSLDVDADRRASE
jgi:hypothetical protein